MADWSATGGLGAEKRVCLPVVDFTRVQKAHLLMTGLISEDRAKQSIDITVFLFEVQFLP